MVGGAIAYISASKVSSSQRRDTHKAAVRAIVCELTENLPKVDNASAPGRLTTAAYDALVVPLYTDLPDNIAHHVSFAYALLHIAGDSVAGLPSTNREIIRTQLHRCSRSAAGLRRKHLPDELRAAGNLTTSWLGGGCSP